MRNNYDTLVVGGGFAGLIAALVSSQKGKKVAVLTKGAGSLVIGGGIVDLLGYVDNKPVKDPFVAISKLSSEHPYNILGIDNLKEAISFFKKTCEENGYPYESNGDSNSWLPTAIGTIKPTFLHPKTRNPSAFNNTDYVIVAGVEGLKDFYPTLVVRGLKELNKYKNKNFLVAMLPNPYEQGRDLNALDIARYVDTKAGKNWLITHLRDEVPTGSVVIMPPILGTDPSIKIFNEVEKELNIKCIETSIMPPSVTGLRIRELLMNELKKNKVEIIELAEVVKADLEGKTCKAIYSSAPDKLRKYTAENYIIATGGFFGGGNIAKPGKAYEMIFNIDLNAPENQEEWSNNTMFSEKPHLFSKMGVKVNKDLNPIDDEGNVLYTNVRFAGRALGGYDYSTEKSGNGVALVSAYVAGRA